MDWRDRLQGRPKPSEPIIWDINNPQHARSFLADLRQGESREPISSVVMEDGQELALDALTDAQAVMVANKVADALQASSRARKIEQAK